MFWSASQKDPSNNSIANGLRREYDWRKGDQLAGSCSKLKRERDKYKMNWGSSRGQDFRNSKRQNHIYDLAYGRTEHGERWEGVNSGD